METKKVKFRDREITIRELMFPDYFQMRESGIEITAETCLLKTLSKEDREYLDTQAFGTDFLDLIKAFTEVNKKMVAQREEDHFLEQKLPSSGEQK